MDDIERKMELPDVKIMDKILSEQDRIIWESMGLTPDVQSMENATLLTKVSLCICRMPRVHSLHFAPFAIFLLFQLLTTDFGSTPIPVLNDPTKSALNWLVKYLNSKEIAFEMTTQHSDRFTYLLELAIRFGKVLIVDDCNEIKPPLLSIILGTTQMRFNKKFLQVGNKLVDFNEHFKVILATRGTKIFSKKAGIIDAFLTVIPFTTTVAGLTGNQTFFLNTFNWTNYLSSNLNIFPTFFPRSTYEQIHSGEAARTRNETHFSAAK